MARAAKTTKKKAVKPAKMASEGGSSRGKKSPAGGLQAEAGMAISRDMGPLKAPLLVRMRRKFFKTLLVVLVVACLLPLLLTLIYIPSSVHPVSTLMVAKWISGQSASRQWVALDDISPFVTQSVISSEDGQYCFHSGVDWRAVNLVVDDLLDGEKARGASTIPMQTVKNT